MKTLIKYEFGKSFLPFAILGAINLISVIFILLKYDFYISGFIKVINDLGILVLTLYAFKNFYEDLYEGKYIATHITPIKTSKIFYAKTMVFSVLFIMLFLSRLPEGLMSNYGFYNTGISKLSDSSIYLIFYIASKVTAYVSGITLLAFSLSYSKYCTKGKIKGAIIIGLAIGVIMTILIAVILNTTVDFGSGESIGFMVGTESTDTVTIEYVQYAAFLPMTTWKSVSSDDASVVIHWVSVITNVILTFILLPLTAYFFNSKKYEVLGK